METKRAEKRPRSKTPTKAAALMASQAIAENESSPSKKKSKSSKNKQKNSQASSRGGPEQRRKKPVTSSNATVEGEMMAKLISTFTKMEQSRFEAFQRCALDTSTVQDWVATCLCDRHGLLLEPSDNYQSSSKQHVTHRSLSDWVGAEQQAQEIGMVVTTLAKIYAQRLVKTASTLASRSTIGDQKPLQPMDIWRAWEQRCQEGLDPGFFLQSSTDESLNEAAIGSAVAAVDPEEASKPVLVTDNESQHERLWSRGQDLVDRRLAALAAQSAYDEIHPPKTNKEGANDGDGESKKAESSRQEKTTEDKMDVDES